MNASDKIEISALKIGVFVNLLMAVAGWIAYYLTGSEALLLDGNFSLISGMTTIGAIMIIQRKHNRSDTFPFGRYFYESLFTFFKGILILGLIITALVQNILKIIEFVQGGDLSRLKTGPIMIYMAAMLILCFGLAYIYSIKNKSINMASPVLGVEAKSSKIDGYMTVAVGLALVLTTLVPDTSKLSFLLYIGDALVVVLMCLFLFRTPFEIIRNGFIELGVGSLQDKEIEKVFEKAIQEHLPENFNIKHRFFSKTGSSYLVLVYVTALKDSVPASSLIDYRQNIGRSLKEKYPNLEVEIAMRKS